MTIVILTLLSIVILLLLFVIISAFFFAIDAFLDLPYVATKREKIETIIKLANVKRGETVVDLGSGDGRLLFAAAQAGARAIGYEINPFLVFLTRIKTKLVRSQNSKLSLRGEKRRGNLKSGRDRHALSKSNLLAMTGKIIVKRQNLWKADLKVADVIFVYGRRNSMQKFQDFVYQNGKSGTRVVVNTNAFPNKKHIKSENGIFLYKL